MRSNEDGTLMIEDAKIIFPNFAGKETEFNRTGARSFCVLLDEGDGTKMFEDGWNVKMPRGDREEDRWRPHLEVAVRFDPIPPRVVMITSRGRTPLTEDTVELLDWAEFINVDIIIRPSHWAVNGKSGVKAYLKTLFAIINEDPLELKYADIPEIGALRGEEL